MENHAITILKKRKAKLDSLKEHNYRIENELPKKIQEWREKGIDEYVIIGRSIRHYGEIIDYNKQELEDINAVLKYLSVDF